jgi:hypothetical protein
MVDLHDLQFVMNKSVFKINQLMLHNFVSFLHQKGIQVDDAIMTEFQEQLPRSFFQLVAQSKKKEPKGQRTPNSYNMFIRDKMKEIKSQQPSLTGKELLKHATQEWNKHKLEKNNIILTQEQEHV